MASHTLNGQPWPDGTVVSVYPAFSLPAGYDVPSGTPVTSGTITAGRVVFKGLDKGIGYVAVASGRTVRFMVPTHSPTDSVRSRLDELEQGERELLSLYEFAEGAGYGDVSSDTNAFELAVASGEDFFIPRPVDSDGWKIQNTVGGLLLTTPGQQIEGRNNPLIQWQNYNGMGFIVGPDADDARVAGLSFEYPFAKPARGSWSSSTGDTALDAFINQDSSISRMASIYHIGSDRVRIEDIRGRNLYSLIRSRARDRFSEQVEDCEIRRISVRNYQMGLNHMNHVNCIVEGLHGRDADSTDTAPSHLYYGAGGGGLPANVTLGTLEADDEAVADMPNVGGGIWNCSDRNNRYSSSYKVRNWRGGTFGQLVNQDCAVLLQSAYNERCEFNGLRAYNLIQIYSQSTFLPVNTGTQIALQHLYSSWCRFNHPYLHTAQGDFVHLYGIRSNSRFNTLNRPHSSFNGATNTFRNPYRLIDSDDNWVIEPSADVAGVDIDVVSLVNSDRNKVLTPLITKATTTWQKIVRNDATSDGNLVVIDPDRTNISPLTVAGAVIDSPGTNFARVTRQFDVPNVASATTITLPEHGEIFTISGTTSITSITVGTKGRRVTLIFNGILTLTDGGVLILAGNFVTTSNDSITLVSDGTNWIEVARSVN